jgi:DNA (cytosine-5)-methyltransferase 1
VPFATRRGSVYDSVVADSRTAADLFAGAGGTTQGLFQAGYVVLGAIENDIAAADTYAANHPEVYLDRRDVRRVQAPAFARKLGAQRIDVLTACPPCQGFSTLGLSDPDDARNNLVMVVERFAAALRPRAILLENVPGLAADRRLAQLERALAEGYASRRYLVDAVHFGVPQHRRRTIVVFVERPVDEAIFPDDLRTLLPRGFDCSRRAVHAVLAVAQRCGAEDVVHRARRSTPKTLERIRAMPIGGGRLDLPPSLRLDCHERLGTRSATSIYGRIDPSQPAPTMTTRCTTPSCGRFVHPSEDRGLTLREAALIQTFPPDYKFEGHYGEVERQIGNAVPVRMAEALGLVVRHLLARPSA